MKHLIATMATILALAATPTFADPANGKWTVDVPSSRKFEASITMQSGNIVGFESSRLGTLRNVTFSKSGRTQTVKFKFSNQHCGRNRDGEMTFDTAGTKPVFLKWKNTCKGKSYTTTGSVTASLG